MQRVRQKTNEQKTVPLLLMLIVSIIFTVLVQI
jgi:hypothetical protein